jgi:8-oxo-dGTP diphosphatase
MPHSTHRICSIVFAENERGEVLLQHRNKRPNLGLWTCVGGKLLEDIGESPVTCAAREFLEETGVAVTEQELQLFGVVNETGYEGPENWLMFLFRLTRRLHALPAPCHEGRHAFHPAADLLRLPLPPVDRSCLWPLYFSRRHELTMLRIDCQGGNDGTAIIEQGPPLPDLKAALNARKH